MSTRVSIDLVNIPKVQAEQSKNKQRKECK